MSRGPKPVPVALDDALRAELVELSRSQTEPFRAVQRARIIVLSADDVPTAQIAARAGCTLRNVRTWRSRFRADPCRETLYDRPRSGRPPRVPPEVRCELVKLACSRPDGSKESKAQLFRDIWTYASLSTALEAATGWKLSESEIGRILRSNALRPHRVRMWLHSPDPNFKPKVRRICELYLSPPPGATVVCVDEKAMFAREHRYPLRAAASGRACRHEFEYIRHGTCALVAAFDVGSGRVFGQVRLRRTANDLVQFMEALAEHHPSGDVYVIWDNLNIHHDGKPERWSAFNARHGGRFHFVYTPIHASWTNQVELWLSILHRRVLKHGSFIGMADLAERVEGFIDHWNDHQARPFNWTFRGDMSEDRRRAA